MEDINQNIANLTATQLIERIQDDRDSVNELSQYLPIVIPDPVEADYFDRYLKAIAVNRGIADECAMFALHQLFMFTCYAFVYANLKENDLAKSHAFVLAGCRPEEREQLKNISSPFGFSPLQESTFFESFALVGVDAVGIKPFKALVKTRNDLAHCGGYTCVDFMTTLDGYKSGLKLLHEKFLGNYTQLLLLANRINFNTDMDMQIDQIRQLFGEYYFTPKMVVDASATIESQGLKLQKNAKKLINQYISMRLEEDSRISYFGC